MVTTTLATARPNLDTQNALGFFTNVANHLLVAQFGLDTTRIQIYPTNQYTPAVHRLLQLAANVYEATSTNSYPSVFRPLFSRDAGGLGTNLFISGFTNVASVSGLGDGRLALPVGIVTLAETNIPVVNLPVNVYGIPWIIGARKGLPNFNEFAMESAFQLFRKLQVTRPSTNSPSTVYHLNQMFILSLSNQFGVECWNSYTNDFTNPVVIYVTDNQTVTLTNDEGLSYTTNFRIANSLRIPNSSHTAWPGYNPTVFPFSTPASFQIPLNIHVPVIPTSMYRFNLGNTVAEPGYVAGRPYLTTNLDSPYELDMPAINGNLYPQPHWYLTTSNDMRVIIMDTAVSPHHIIDYVQLSGPNSTRDLTSEIITNYDTPILSTQVSGNELWNTNFLNGIPIGIISQLGVSLYHYTAGPLSGPWDTSAPAIQNGIDAFRAFFHLLPIWNNASGQVQIAASYMTNAILAPYTPVATVVQHISWQANDPLVHYLASDLNWPGAVVFDMYVASLTNNNLYGTLGMLNQNYMPWGGHQPVNPHAPDFSPINAYNLALKDPLVWNSDDWDSPSNESLSDIGEWLGRVHRGTPWQTVYLKAANILVQTNDSGSDIGTNTWMTWTGDTNAADAVAMAPVQDWHVASLLADLMNPRHLQARFPVNDPKTNAWLRLLHGLTALTNTLSDNQLASGAVPQFETLVIRHHSPQARLIAEAIESEKNSQPDGLFHDVGDILEVPELSDQSPFLNWNDTVQQQRGISDEAYEILPSQLLPLLRVDSIGCVGSMHGKVIARFTGYDNHTYAIEESSNLEDWTSVSTNLCQNGKFNFTNSAPSNVSSQFYRSRLVQ